MLKNHSPTFLGIKYPDMDNYQYFEPEKVMQVNEEWGWEQLSAAEYNEYLEGEGICFGILADLFIKAEFLMN